MLNHGGAAFPDAEDDPPAGCGMGRAEVIVLVEWGGGSRGCGCCSGPLPLPVPLGCRGGHGVFGSHCTRRSLWHFL